MKRAQQITTSTFADEVLERKGLVMVEFYADWCPNCREMKPVLDQVAEEFDGRARILKVNVDEEPTLVSLLCILAVPTIAVFRDGEVVDGIVGAVPEEVLRDKLQGLGMRSN